MVEAEMSQSSMVWSLDWKLTAILTMGYAFYHLTHGIGGQARSLYVIRQQGTHKPKSHFLVGDVKIITFGNWIVIFNG